MAFEVESQGSEPLRGAAWIESPAKRNFDKGLALVIAAPTMLLIGGICLSAFIEDGKAPLFRQARVGRDGQEFGMWKIRTMDRTDYQDHTHTLDDPRITSVGRVIRKFALDEAPQIWHILTGKMSFVGLRPLPSYSYDEMREHLEPDEFSDWYDIKTRFIGGYASTFANLGRVEALKTPEVYCRERYVSDMADFGAASFKNDLRLLQGSVSTVATNIRDPEGLDD